MWINVSQMCVVPPRPNPPEGQEVGRGGLGGHAFTSPMNSSFWIKSFSSLLLREFLSPSLPEDLWEMDTSGLTQGGCHGRGLDSELEPRCRSVP